MRRVVVVEIDEGRTDDVVDRMQQRIVEALIRKEPVIVIEGARMHSMEVDDEEVTT